MKTVENGSLTGFWKNARARNLHLKTASLRMRVRPIAFENTSVRMSVRATAFENGFAKTSSEANSLKEMQVSLKTRGKSRFQFLQDPVRDLRFQFLGKRVCVLGKKVCFFRRPYTLHTITLFMRPSASVLQDLCFQFLASAGMFDPTPLYDYSVRGASSDTTHILTGGMFSMGASSCMTDHILTGGMFSMGASRCIGGGCLQDEKTRRF